VLIRPLTVADAVAFWNMRLRAFTESPGSFNTSPDEWRSHPLADIERMLRGEKGGPSDVVLGAFAPQLSAHVCLQRETRRAARRSRTAFTATRNRSCSISTRPGRRGSVASQK
jgi:hypothetical protein